MVRPIKAAKNRAIANRMLQNQQAKKPTPQGTTPQQQANDAIQDYYRELNNARVSNERWLYGGEGVQSESDMEARDWILRQINGDNRSSLSTEQINGALRNARRDDPRPRR